MATAAHAFYCFEVLASSYRQLPHPNLETVIRLCAEWQQEQAETEISGRTVDEVEEDHNRSTGQLHLPTISKLRDVANPSSSDASTPSSASENSSHTQLTNTASESSSVPPATYASAVSATADYPLFVTWNTLRGSHKSLRGCIGTFEGLPLEKGLEQYALTSAFEDTRFAPIAEHNLPNIGCSLTLLADFEETEGPFDWELGKHGIRISFTHRQRRHGATYLPDVAVEQGWSKEETLESLMHKAGWDGSRRFRSGGGSPWDEVKDFRTVRYTGLKASATYAEWQEWQKWAKDRKPDAWLD